MTLDLTSLDVKVGTTLPVAQRGRTAAVIPDSILTAVRETYTLPEGQGATIKVPNGQPNAKGNDTNVVQMTGLLRRAAKDQGYGISITIGEPNSRTTPVTFRAKDYTPRPRTIEETEDVTPQEDGSPELAGVDSQ